MIEYKVLVVQFLVTDTPVFITDSLNTLLKALGDTARIISVTEAFMQGNGQPNNRRSFTILYKESN